MLFQSLGSRGALAGNHIFPAPDSCHSHSSLCFKCVFSGQEQKGLSQIQIAGSAFPGRAQVAQVVLLYGGTGACSKGVQIFGVGYKAQTVRAPQNPNSPPADPIEVKSGTARPSFKTLLDEPRGCDCGIAATWWQCAESRQGPKEKEASCCLDFQTKMYVATST